MEILLGASDLFVTPYTTSDGSASGTLTYSVNAGTPVLSTWFPYAKELLKDDKGLVYYKNYSL